MIKPNAEFDIITDITIDFLKGNNIKGLILDVDNTLIDLSRNKIEGLDDWINSMIESVLRLQLFQMVERKDKLSY